MNSFDSVETAFIELAKSEGGVLWIPTPHRIVDLYFWSPPYVYAGLYDDEERERQWPIFATARAGDITVMDNSYGEADYTGSDFPAAPLDESQ